MINWKLKYLFLILFLASCSGEKQDEYDKMPLLYPAPRTVALNTEDGYIINQVTGDTIRPIVNSFGDTIKTGVPVSAIGKVINPNSVLQPKVFPAGKAEVVLTNLNVHKIPETLNIITVNKDSIETFTPGIVSSSFVLVNSTGDTIPTGIPILAKGKVVPCIQPHPVKALLPHIKDYAIVNMKYMDVEQGMNSSYIRTILEDSHSNLWFGTDVGGVSMYNGEYFMHFTEKEGLSNNTVYSILQDSQGNIWFGTWGGGVSMYDGETFTHFTEKEGLSNNYVYSILEDSQGNLWFGTWGGGVSKYDGETFTHFTIIEGLSNNYVTSILEDRHGILWFGTSGGLSKYDGEAFTRFTKKEGLSSNNVRSILEDSHGDLWFGTISGVSMYNGKTFTHFTEKEGLSNNSVTSIQEDRHENLWFGTWGGGVSMYNRETLPAGQASFTHFTEKEGLSSNIVSSILVGSTGNLWFGTIGGGVSIYNGENFTHLTEKEGLSNNIVRAILEDVNGNLWFGTYGGGVSKYDGENFTHLTEKEGLSSNLMYSIFEDRHGSLWFGTESDGVIKYNGKTFTHFTENEGLISNNYVTSILEDIQGNLWFGTDGGGVSMYNGETLPAGQASFTHFTEKEGLISNKVYSILEDKHGNLWFGTSRGVSKYDGETFTHFTEKEGLSNNTVQSILEDSYGNLWFGTDGGGVSMYNGETLSAGQASFTHFTEKEGLCNNIVWSILEDNNRNIWLSTEKGLNCLIFGPDSIYRIKNSLVLTGMKEDKVIVASYNPLIQTYSQQDGLKGMDFYVNSALLDSKNHIWWGSGKNLAMLDMNNFQIPVGLPTIQLNRININEQFVDYRHLSDSAGLEMEFNGVARFYNYPLNLELPYNNNHITFYFSAIDWSAPHKIRYSYKMEGIGDNWSVPTAETKADYRGLNYGTYSFKVRAIGGSQKWSEPFEYTFTINPPWWQTWWARSGYGIFTLLLIYGFVHWRTDKLKQRQKVLEQIVTERTSEIIEQKKKITDSIQYAKVIQDSILIQQDEIKEIIPHSFVYFKPRDIVSGDFYWVARQGEYIIVAAIDCTGHGVPGGFMCMIGNTLLNLIVKERGIIKPSEILNILNLEVIKALQQEHRDSLAQDGMDMAVCTIDPKNNSMQYAGAKNPLYMVTGDDLQIFEADPFSIGGTLLSKKRRSTIRFKNQEIKYKTGSSIYLFSDGYADQFGGSDNKSFNTSRLSELLLPISKLPAAEQYSVIENEMNKWMGSTRQIDDMLIIGIKL